MLRLPLYLLVIGGLISSAGLSAQADTSGKFYEKDIAKSVFGPDVVVVPKPTVDPKTGEKKPTDTADVKSKIIEEFGDPKETKPVLAIESAPTPFRGMMKALQEGQDELAFDYAKQYARYLRDYKDRTLRVTGLTQLAMVSEGALTKQSVQDSPLTQQDLYLLEKDLEEQRKEQRSYAMKIDPRALEILDRAEQEERGLQLNRKDVAALQSPEMAEKERERARSAIRNRAIPVATDGQVDVFFFFRQEDSRSISMIPTVETLLMIVGEDTRVRISGMLLERQSEKLVDNYREKIGVSYPIEPGVELAAKLGVTSSPTIVFVSRSTGQALFEEGERSVYYLEEILRQMQGGAQG